MSTGAAQVDVICGYESVKRAAGVIGCSVKDLLVLAPANDPFFCGTPAQIQAAEWFRDLWDKFGYTNGMHLRRMHYQVLSTRAVRRDGTPYENTVGCWAELCMAGKYARSLGLVDPLAFEDHRNPDPMLFASYHEAPAIPRIMELEDMNWSLPVIDAELDFEPLEVPTMDPDGYSYDLGDQSYHVEVWIEKSTMNDVLIPVCQRHGVNLVTSVGFQSISSALGVAQRARRSGKATRILYISDFDPAGGQMPIAVARQIEFYREHYAPDCEIKLQPIVLTRDQVEEFQLPRVPIKDTDRRRGNFEERFGEGAVELDALEALHPGELARIVEAAIQEYRDPSLDWRLRHAESEAEEIVTDAWDAATSEQAVELEAINEEARAITETFKDRLTVLSTELAAQLAPLNERLETVRRAIQQVVDDFEPELPNRPEPELTEADESGWLFDSGRTYLQQLRAYRARKGDDADEVLE